MFVLSQKLKSLKTKLKTWNKECFGDVNESVVSAELHLHQIQMQIQQIGHNDNLLNEEKLASAKLEDVLSRQEAFWQEKARLNWQLEGDKNTKYFHMKANLRRKRNRIDSIRDPQGNVQHEEEKIEQVFLEHFQNLFTCQNTYNIHDTVKVVKGKITPDMHKDLSEEFTRAEVYQAIKDMKALAAPGPDGLPALFYHNYWDILGDDITNMVLDVLNNNGDPSNYNSTYICLIPKNSSPSTPSDFRPISLCNVTMKTITKTIANRLKTILPDVISPNQSAFIKGRLITDNTLKASEIFQYLKNTNRKSGYVGIKTDMAKAYDRV
jgi:hypothetical protein